MEGREGRNTGVHLDLRDKLESGEIREEAKSRINRERGTEREVSKGAGNLAGKKEKEEKGDTAVCI